MMIDDRNKNSKAPVPNQFKGGLFSDQQVEGNTPTYPGHGLVGYHDYSGSGKDYAKTQWVSILCLFYTPLPRQIMNMRGQRIPAQSN